MGRQHDEFVRAQRKADRKAGPWRLFPSKECGYVVVDCYPGMEYPGVDVYETLAKAKLRAAVVVADYTENDMKMIHHTPYEWKSESGEYSVTITPRTVQS